MFRIRFKLYFHSSYHKTTKRYPLMCDHLRQTPQECEFLEPRKVNLKDVCQVLNTLFAKFSNFVDLK